MKYKNYILLIFVLLTLVFFVVFSTNFADVDESPAPETTEATSQNETMDVPHNEFEENIVSEPDTPSNPTPTPPTVTTPPAQSTQVYTPPQTQVPATPTNTSTPPPPLTALESAIQGNGSQRCQWVDRASGADKIVLIKNGAIRVRTEEISDDIYITLYNSVATYTWKDGEKSGIIIVDDTHPTASKFLYETRDEITKYLTESNRVKCDSASLSDFHFTVPTDIAFIRLDA